MQTSPAKPKIIHARCIATGIKSALAATRLIWAGSADGGDQAAWSALTDGLERLSAFQIQQRFAAEGIEMSLDAAAQLQVEAVIERPRGEVPVIELDDEHAVAPIDVGNGAGLHDVEFMVTGVDTVAQGGAA